jgi:hypothetical protein
MRDIHARLDDNCAADTDLTGYNGEVVREARKDWDVVHSSRQSARNPSSGARSPTELIAVETMERLSITEHQPE